MDRSDNNWINYQKLVLAELERHSTQLDLINTQLHRHMSEIQVEIAMLKVKAGIWGVIGGAIPVVLFIVLDVLKKR